ncbi:MAG TPA: nucleoside kinase [Treponemataceae bacterium]|nr:nucleoside kinase [Treponemataceae bacterium]
MSKITIEFSNKKTIETNALCPVSDVISNLGIDKEKIIAVRLNNQICPLSEQITNSAYIEPVFVNSSEGSAIYRRSLCFVLAVASHKLFPSKRLIVGHSLGHGYYYTFDGDTFISQDAIHTLHIKMKEIIEANEQIVQSYLSYREATELFEKLDLKETRKQLRYICPPRIRVNTLHNFSDLYFAPLVPSTGYLKYFEIMPYKEGFLLRFPPTSTPENIYPFKDIPQLFNVYKKYKDWGKQIGVTSAASLNEMLFTGKMPDFIDITETLQNKHIADVAEMIDKKNNVKLVLIAGPSGSGKTTTSKKLALQLRALGYTPHLISLDNYYVNRENTPRDEKGDYDYECLEALDVAQLNEDLVNLFAGKTVEIPFYSFAKGARHYNGNTITLLPHDILILEGIHGLNDKLTPLIKTQNKFKIYLSALTQLNLDDHNRIPTSDNRLIRRIVRDSQFRSKTAAETIKMWPSVQRGEQLHIFPFQDNADVMLNTALDYELAVLKVYATPLLRCVSPLEHEYSEASRLLAFLNNFPEIPEVGVPGHSLLREFIGGSCFKY